MTAAPVTGTDRIVALDVLRGFVLLGILVMNIQSFGMPIAAYMNPTAYGDLTGANLWVWIASHVFFDQKFIAVFSMLFGAGVVLMTSRAGAAGKGLHRRRMGWLVLFGLLHAHLFWYGDILYAYGMAGLIAVTLRHARPRTLIAAAGFCLVLGSAIPVGMMTAMPADQAADMRDTMWRPTPERIDAELAAYRGGPLSQASHRTPEALAFETFIFAFFVIWKILALMWIGMALLKTDVLTARRTPRFYATMAAAGFGVGLPLVIWGMRENFAHGWSFEYSMLYGGQWNYWGSVAVALGYIATIMAVVRSGALGALGRRLAAVGRTAFSNYILQTVIATTIFYGHGFGLFGSVERTGLALIVLGIWALQLIVSPIWLRHYRFGPLEWLWRTAVYLEPPPMRLAR